MKATNLYGLSSRKWPEKDSLFFKFQGPTPRALAETADVVRRITKAHGATGFVAAASEREALDLWMDRKNGLYSSLALLPGSRAWSTDVWCVDCAWFGRWVGTDSRGVVFRHRSFRSWCIKPRKTSRSMVSSLRSWAMSETVRS